MEAVSYFPKTGQGQVRVFENLTSEVAQWLEVGQNLKETGIAEGQTFLDVACISITLFMAAVLNADDPRYKQPTNFYLAIMLFMT